MLNVPFWVSAFALSVLDLDLYIRDFGLEGWCMLDLGLWIRGFVFACWI